MESENLIIRVCCVRAGWISNLNPRGNHIGSDCFQDKIFLYIFFNDDDEAIGYALDNMDGSFSIESCEPCDVDSFALREALPKSLSRFWNSILLATVDLEEIDEERLEYKIYYRDDEAENSARPFNVGFDFEDLAQLHGLLAAYKIFGWLMCEDKFEGLNLIEAIKNCEINEPILVKSTVLGDVVDFETESETLCILL